MQYTFISPPLYPIQYLHLSQFFRLNGQLSATILNFLDLISHISNLNLKQLSSLQCSMQYLWFEPPNLCSHLWQHGPSNICSPLSKSSGTDLASGTYANAVSSAILKSPNASSPILSIQARFLSIVICSLIVRNYNSEKCPTTIVNIVMYHFLCGSVAFIHLKTFEFLYPSKSKEITLCAITNTRKAKCSCKAI